EAHPILLLRRNVRVRWNTSRLCHWRIVGPESAVAVRIFAATAIVGVSGVVSWLCCAGWHMAPAHMGADWSCRRADSGFDVACGNCDEAWLLCRSPGGDESFPRGIPDVERIDRCAGSDRNRVCGGSGASPT